MRKLYNVLKLLAVLFVAVVLFVSLIAFVYDKYQSHKESALLEGKGTLVDFNGKKINVYHEGSGEETYVFMPGSGIAAPLYELKGLYTKFSQDNKIAVVERAGYGYSDVFDDGRDIDTILKQTREALIQSGHEPPYILVPHSISGIEAIYWAQKYPNEVRGIIALDIGLPHQYVTHKMGVVDSFTVRGMNLLTKIGIHRLVPSATYNSEVTRQTFLTEEEKEIYKALSYKQIFNNDMEQELLKSYDNSKKSVDLPLPKETPILFIDAIALENQDSIYTKQNSKDYEEFAKQLRFGDVVNIQGTHSIYLYAPDQIYERATEFMTKVNEAE